MAEGGSQNVRTDAEVTELIGRMRDRRGIIVGDHDWSVTGTWTSFFASFVLVESEVGKTAIKFGRTWTPEDVEYVHAEIDRVAELFAGLPGGSVDVPQSLGWLHDPAAMALEYVDGVSLSDVLRDPDHDLWTNDGRQLEAVIRQCGEAVGAYHSAQPAPDDPAIAKLALDDLRSAARRAGVRWSKMAEIEAQLLRARGYRFSHNDLFINDAGRLVMLDPPHVDKYDYVHRDLSALTFELHRALIGDRPLRRDEPRRAMLDRLRRAFLDGYAQTGPSPLTSDLDRWVLGVFEISRVTGMAYSRVRQRRIGAAIAPLRWVLQARRALGRMPAAPSK